jgi:hypothetical protein
MFDRPVGSSVVFDRCGGCCEGHCVRVALTIATHDVVLESVLRSPRHQWSAVVIEQGHHRSIGNAVRICSQAFDHGDRFSRQKPS